jgi:hypothetical protein
MHPGSSKHVFKEIVMNALYSYRSVVFSRIVAALAAAILTVGAVGLPQALIVLGSATVGATPHVSIRSTLN